MEDNEGSEVVGREEREQRPKVGEVVLVVFATGQLRSAVNVQGSVRRCPLTVRRALLPPRSP